MIATMTGCISSEIVVEPTRQWEGHFYTTNEVQFATQRMQLNEGESVWILSNSTLKRVLKNVK